MAITITPSAHSIRVAFKGTVIASSARALDLREGRFGAVKYIPRADADMSKLVPTAHRTTCPHKGEASYFSIETAGGRSENAVWSYETPHAEVAAIRGHLAFYPSLVDAIEEF